MNPSAIFVRRPVMTTLVMIAILVFGVMAYMKLSVSDLPNVDFPTIEVRAELSGANPETMASSVATPLEKQFSTISGLDSMTSISGLGSTRITLQFDLERDIDNAALDVQSAITTALRRLPEDMTQTPSFRKVNPAASSILYLSLSSPTMRLSDVNEYAENFMAQRISMVSGVAQVMVYGSQKYAVRIQLSPERLASMELGVDEVAEAVRQGNVNLPVGIVAGPVREYIVRSNGKLLDAEDYKPLVVAWRNGAPVRLTDVADVFDSVSETRRRNWYNDQPGIVLAIQRQPGTNTVEVVQSVLDLLPTFQKRLPAAVKLDVLYDRSRSIRDSIEDVQFTLLLTVALVIMVIFLFLRRVSATVIPSLALPMSIIGAFAVMYLYGFSLNNITLMALTLSVGFVVDDAIVMLENIVRHGEMGKSTMEAVYDGSREIAFTIVSMTISLAAVFLPVLFMGGIVGRLFHEFAVTICASILISGLVSLTLTPMLCNLILRPQKRAKRHSDLLNFFERGFDSLRHFYSVTLDWTIRHRRVVMLAFFVILVMTVILFQSIPKGFLPIEDTGRLMVRTESEQGVPFATMMQRQKALMKIVSGDEAVQGYMSVVGGGGPNRGGNSGRLMINLKPIRERDRIEVVQQRLRSKLSQEPGIRAYVSNPPAIRIGGRTSKGQYQYTLQSPNTEELFLVTAEMEKRMQELPGIQDVSSDMEFDNPELNIVIDRDKASALGISAYQVEDALSTSFGNRKVSSIYASTDTYDVIMELAPEYQSNPDALSMLSVRSRNGKLVRLETLAKWNLGVGPLTVNHSGQLPSATISFNLPPGESLGTAVDTVSNLAREIVPSSVSTNFQGEARAFQDSMSSLWLLLTMAILVIYIVLGVLYESFVHPLTILSGLPSAGAGALMTLMLFRLDLNIYGFVGIIMLIGIVKKNAIMMIDFAIEAQRRAGTDATEAIREGALIRFRPIMMTTMAALMGTLPIALGFGAGAEARRPLGLAVVGGLVVSQLLTLYFTPVYYIYLDAVQQRLKGIFRGSER